MKGKRVAIKLFLVLLTFTNVRSGQSGSYWTVYFDSDTLDVKLARFIGGAQYSLDICFYEIFRDTVAKSILNAKRRGVKVRVITDSTYFYRAYLDSLRNAGIPVIHEGIGSNETSHVMHNKFIVRDGRDQDTTNDYVWTGSYNASDYTRLNAENAIIIKSSSVANCYLQEFNQMWGSSGDLPDSLNSRTGTRKTDVCSQHLFVIGTDSIWVYFSPQNRPIQYLINFVNQASDSIGYLIYSYTRRDLADAMASAFRRGVFIGGVHDASDTGSYYSQFHYLRDTVGIPVYGDRLPSNYSLLHHKFMVIDKRVTITGSMNWSNNGNQENDENVIIIKNSQIAGAYWSEFKKRWGEATGIREEFNEGRTFIFKGPGLIFNFSDFKVFSADGKLLKEERNNFWDGKDSEGKELQPGIYFVVPLRSDSPIKVLKLH